MGHYAKLNKTAPADPEGKIKENTVVVRMQRLRGFLKDPDLLRSSDCLCKFQIAGVAMQEEEIEPSGLRSPNSGRLRGEGRYGTQYYQPDKQVIRPIAVPCGSQFQSTPRIQSY